MEVARDFQPVAILALCDWLWVGACIQNLARIAKPRTSHTSVGGACKSTHRIAFPLSSPDLAAGFVALWRNRVDLIDENDCW